MAPRVLPEMPEVEVALESVLAKFKETRKRTRALIRQVDEFHHSMIENPSPRPQQGKKAG